MSSATGPSVPGNGSTTTGRLPVGGTRLIATDLDGTLLDADSRVAPRTKAAVLTIRRKGIPVIPVTGRPPQSMWHIADEAGLGPVGVCSNGAMTVDLATHEVLKVNKIVKEEALSILELLRSVQPELLVATDNSDCFTHDVGFFDTMPAWESERLVEGGIETALLDGTIKLVARRPGSAARELLRELEELVSAHGVPTISGLDWVEIGPQGASKASALEEVACELGVSQASVVAIGDSLNDLPMLEWAGYAIAPGTAMSEVKSLVDFVMPPGTGIADVLEELSSSAGAP